jgi:hypothetical protein
MRFAENGIVTHPAAVILETMIERMEVIAPFLRNVERIDTIDRTPLAGGRVRIVRRWQGSAASVPARLRRFVTPAMLAWLDTAVWHPDDHRVEWSHASCVPGVAQLYDCAGTNWFRPDPGAATTRTAIRITGELTVHPERVPGVPAFLGRTLAPQVESFVVGLVTPNLVGLADGLQRYFDRPPP